MSFIGNGVGRQMIMPGQIAPAAVGMSQLDSTLSNTFSLRNRIINGDCRIAQRGSLVCTNGVLGYGGPDRFVTSNVSAGGQFTQSAGSITYNGVTRAAVVQTVNTPPTTIDSTHSWNGIQQRIEGYNCYDLIGQQATLSFIFNTNVTGIYSVAVADGPAAWSVVSSFNATANVPVKVVVTLPTLTGGVSIPNSNGVGLYVTIGQIGNLTAPSNNVWLNANNACASGYVNWATVAGNFIALTELQLEAGVTATPFERRPYGIELALCHRYYHQIVVPQWSGNWPGVVYTTTNVMCKMPVPVALRNTPTVSVTGSGQWYLVNTGANLAYASAAQQGATDIQLQFTGSSLTTGGNVVGNSSSTAFTVSVSAEL